MAHVITSVAGVVTPSAIVEYESTRDTHTQVHDIITRSLPDASLRVAGSRSGRMTLSFTGAAAQNESANAEAILAGASTFALTSDFTTLQMTFVLPEGGRLNRKLTSSGAAWHVEFDWREVS